MIGLHLEKSITSTEPRDPFQLLARLLLGFIRRGDENNLSSRRALYSVTSQRVDQDATTEIGSVIATARFKTYEITIQNLRDTLRPFYESHHFTGKLEVKYSSQSVSRSRQIQVWPVRKPSSERLAKKSFVHIAIGLANDPTAAIFYTNLHLDFDIAWQSSGMSIQLRELHRAFYENDPSQSAVWPPTGPDRRPSGEARKIIDLEQGHKIEVQSSAADLRCFKDFLVALTGWDLQFCGSATYALKAVKGSNGVKNCRAGVSVWSKGEELRIHCRNHQENIWVSTSLTRFPFPPVVSGFPSPTLSRQTNGTAVALAGAVNCRGPYILLSTFTADGDVGPASQTQNFEFEKEGYAERFTIALAQHVVEP